jgi:hypothetical protein
MRKPYLVLALWAVAAASVAAHGDDIGYSRLQEELGDKTPNGAGVPVTQIEAPLTNSPDATDYFPMLTNSDGSANGQFTGKTVTPQTNPYTTSSHATTVGTLFYGNTGSIAPGITSVNVYNANDWIGTGFLNPSTSPLPDFTTDRVANSSWIGYDSESGTTTFSASATLDDLHRLDYVIATDDYINCVAENNPDNGGAMPLLADSFNAISVGLTNGTATSGTTAELDDPQNLYIGGRAAPDVVVPMGATSYATPLVASTAALLVEVAHDHPSLSSGSFTSSRTGLQLEYGETNDVIKAAIMAGADRVTNNQDTSDQIAGYGTEGYQTRNGLDTRYGAGQLDVYNSYHIIAAGQQGPNAAPIGTYGFDYNPASAEGAVENYVFSGQYGVAATLVWNIHIADDLSATLAHFQLQLFDLSAGGGSVSVAVSDSMIDNTQNIYVNGLNTGDTYELQVTRNDGLAEDWDYGLAWDLAPAPEPGSAAMIFLGTMSLLRRRNLRFGFFASRTSA